MDTLAKDVGYALRTLRRSGGATAAMLFALMLGTGATTAIFSVVNGVWLKALPYPEADRIVTISEVTERSRDVPVTTPVFYDWRDTSRSFEAIAVHTPTGYPGPRVVLGGDQPVRTLVSGVSAEFFEVLGVAPQQGRLFRADEHDEGGPPVALVSHDYWRTQLGSRPDFAGTQLTIDSNSYTVVGVLPAGFHYPADSDVWIPWRPYYPGRRNHNWVTVARLRDGVALDTAQREMSAITGVLKDQYGSDQDAIDANITLLRDGLVGSTRQPLALLFGAAAMLLLVASANVASMQLARGMARRPELAVRAALGAGGGRLIRQLFVESLVLAVAGGALGLASGTLIARGLLRLAPDEIASASTGLDYRVMAFALVVAAGSALLFGLMPAWQSARASSAVVLRGSGRGQTRAGRRGWQAMVVVEVGAAVVLLVVGGLLLRSFEQITRIDPGFDSRQVLTVDMSLPESVYPDDPSKVALFDRLDSLLEALPGVEAAGLNSGLPLLGSRMSSQVEIEGSEPVGSASYRVVNSDYFGVLRIPLIRGRLFDDRDRAGAPHAALVNATLAEELWPGEDPIGRRIGNFGNDNGAYRGTWTTVIGVVGDVRDATLTADPRPTVFVNAAQRPFRTERLSLTLRVTAPLGTVAPRVREGILAVAPDVPIEIATYDARLARLTATRSFLMLVLGAFAIAALALAAVGIYGVVSYTVTQRTREIGVRMALGATARNILNMVIAGSYQSVLIGLLVGGAAALALGRVLESLLFEVSPADPVTFAVVAVVLAVAAGIASYLPARRSTRVDPMLPMRGE